MSSFQDYYEIRIPGLGRVSDDLIIKPDYLNFGTDNRVGTPSGAAPRKVREHIRARDVVFSVSEKKLFVPLIKLAQNSTTFETITINFVESSETTLRVASTFELGDCLVISVHFFGPSGHTKERVQVSLTYETIKQRWMK